MTKEGARRPGMTQRYFFRKLSIDVASARPTCASGPISKILNPILTAAAIKAAAEGPLKGILRYTEKPLCSSDIIGDPASSIFAGDWTQVMGDTMLKIMSWYDNEWGYSNRSVDLIEKVAKL